jgi:hypothetical protein
MLKAMSQDLEQLFEHWKILHYKYISFDWVKEHLHLQHLFGPG